MDYIEAPAPVPPPAPLSGPEGPVHHAWQRNLILVALAVVLIGGGVGYFFRLSNEETLYQAPDYPVTAQPDTTPDTDPYEFESGFIDYSTGLSPTSGFSTFQNRTYGFQIDYPTDWEVEADAFASFFTSRYEGLEDLILENASVAIENLAYYGYTDMTLDEYTELSLGGLLTDPDYSLAGRGSRALGPYEGRYLLGAYNLGGIELEVLQIFTLQDNVVYLFTYTYELENKDFWEDVADHMIDSFDLLSFADGLKDEFADLNSLGRTSFLDALRHL